MKKYAVLTALLLSGCATAEADWSGGPPEAVAQGLADCRAASNMSPAMANATANPFGAAAMQQQYVADCMRAKGFH